MGFSLAVQSVVYVPITSAVLAACAVAPVSTATPKSSWTVPSGEHGLGEGVLPTANAQKNEALAMELTAMLAEDQAMRRELMHGTMENPPAELLERGRTVDERNTRRLDEIVDQHGWPGRALVGAEAADAAVVLVLHADRSLAFQERCLALMMAAAQTGDLGKPSVAIVVDRVRTSKGQLQLYGTQAELHGDKLLPAPILDPEHVDERRAAMDMPPLAEFLVEQQQAFEAHMRAAQSPGSVQ